MTVSLKGTMQARTGSQSKHNRDKTAPRETSSSVGALPLPRPSLNSTFSLAETSELKIVRLVLLR